jgi:hypothetical protein
MLHTTIRRPRPAKPVKQTPVEITKQATTAEALQLLNQFVREARKEIRQRDTIDVVGRRTTTTELDTVTFLSYNFSLTIDFKGGIAV